MNSDEIRNVKRLYSALLCVCVCGRISKIRPFTFISTIFYFIFISSCCACALVNIDIVIESAVLHQASAAVVVAHYVFFRRPVLLCRWALSRWPF